MDLRSTFESRVPLRHPIWFKLGEHCFSGYAEEVKFVDDGDVLYTIIIYPRKDLPKLALRLTDIPFAFVEKQVPIEKKSESA